MAGLAPRWRNTGLDAMAGQASHVAAHQADPGNTDTAASAEVSTARVAIAWDTATGGVLSQNGTDVLSISASSTAAYVSFWTALSGGLYLGSINTNDEAFTSEGNVDLMNLSITLPVGTPT